MTKSARIKLLERKLRKAQRELRLATLPTIDQQEELLLPELDKELTSSQQLALLRSDVKAWNNWYASVDQHADLRHADLRHADLVRADLVRADLWGANLWGANLQVADLRDADLVRADLRDANLWGANLWDASLVHADLRHADLRHADLRYANLRGANLVRADLQDAKYDQHTEFPKGFDPESDGTEIV